MPRVFVSILGAPVNGVLRIALQAYILFRAALAEPFTHAPGPESLETALVAPEDIPWDQVRGATVP